MQTSQAISTTGPRGYFQWLKQNQPKIYAAILPKLKAQGLSGLGDDNLEFDSNLDSFTLPPVTAVSADTSSATVDPTVTAPTGTAPASWVNNIQSLVGTAASAYLTASQINAQSQLTTIQLQRAAQGLSPLAVSPGAYGLPTVTAPIKLSTVLLFGGLGLLVVMAMSQPSRRR